MWKKSEWNRGFQPQKMALSYSKPLNVENCSNKVWRWDCMKQSSVDGEWDCSTKPVCRTWLWLRGVPWGLWAARGNHQQHLPNAAPALSAALCRLANVMSDEEKGKSERAVQPLNLSVETSVGKVGGTVLEVLIMHLEIVQPDFSAIQVCAWTCHFRKVGKVLLTRYHNSWRPQVYRPVF